MNIAFRQRLEAAKPIEVCVSDIQHARGRAGQLFPAEWQAELIELLLLPEMYAHWQAINYRAGTITYHPGDTPPKPPFHEKREGWAKIRGYTFREGEFLGWNSVRDSYWAHSPSSTWNGIRRETYYMFVEWVRFLASHYAGECRATEEYFIRALWDYKVTVINDLSSAMRMID